MPVTLITGPVRSGKSRYAVAMAQSFSTVTYVATAMRDPDDAEWEARLQRHFEERPPHWRTFESALNPPEAFIELFTQAAAGECIVVDAMGTWIAARIGVQIEAFERDYTQFEAALDREARDLVQAMLSSRAEVIVVAEEVGWDVVPVAPSARMFRDVLGRAKQRLAAGCERAFLVVCGYALDLRKIGVAIP